jgi:hypothetical protein
MRQGTSEFINVFQVYPNMFRQRPPEDGSHLPKHVGVNLEYINKSTSSLTHFFGHFTTKIATV